MSKKPHKRKPGDYEIRISPDGRVYLVAADEAMLDLAESLDPENPAVLKRRKAKASGQSRSREPDSPRTEESEPE